MDSFSSFASPSATSTQELLIAALRECAQQAGLESEAAPDRHTYNCWQSQDPQVRPRQSEVIAAFGRWREAVRAAGFTRMTEFTRKPEAAWVLEIRAARQRIAAF